MVDYQSAFSTKVEVSSSSFKFITNNLIYKFSTIPWKTPSPKKLNEKLNENCSFSTPSSETMAFLSFSFSLSRFLYYCEINRDQSFTSRALFIYRCRSIYDIQKERKKQFLGRYFDCIFLASHRMNRNIYGNLLLVL